MLSHLEITINERHCEELSGIFAEILRQSPIDARLDLSNVIAFGNYN
jgi:hypothetical protein